jgi:hypothetical protein
MKKITEIPSHYRQLHRYEKVHDGDLYKHIQTGDIGIIRDVLQNLTAGRLSSTWTYWRRKHVTTNTKTYKAHKNSFYDIICENDNKIHYMCQCGKNRECSGCVGVKVKDKQKEQSKLPFHFYPMVKFCYPNKMDIGSYPDRYIRMVAANKTHITGLDINDKFKFKKFLRSKIVNLEVIEYNNRPKKKKTKLK